MNGLKIKDIALSKDRAIFINGGNYMKFQEGYVYHIKDDYFNKVQDDKLMQNKEGGTYRPTFFCMRDNRNADLLWVVPMSTRTEKYQAIYDKQKARYGKCLTIVLGEFDGKKAAYLLQNMFPITEEYLDHIHTKNGNPIPVSHSTAKEIRSNIKQLRELIDRGRKVVFPNVIRLEQLMMRELNLAKRKTYEEQLALKKQTEEYENNFEDEAEEYYEDDDLEL